MVEYQSALADVETNRPNQADEAKRGSFRYLCIRYYASGHFRGLDISTPQLATAGLWTKSRRSMALSP